LRRFSARDNGLKQINRPFQFVQCLHRAYVGSRASVALMGDGQQGAALGGIS
jgi:hypothetical protein